VAPEEGDAALPPQAAGSGAGTSALQYSGGTLDDQPGAYGGEGYAVAADEPHAAAAAGPVPVQQRRVDEHEQLGRNDPCWCGSGKKFKKCHGA
jgi:preprotein translocase subunit SecA